MKIKICGLFRPEDIDYANITQPDYIGFVFWEKSRRNVTRELAKELRKKLSENIQAVGVFLNAPVEEVISLLEDGIIDIAQLHGDETEKDIRYIRETTSKPVIKAVKVRNVHDVEAWLDSTADYLMFDSGTGSGRVFDWSMIADVKRKFFLAGGINPENIAEAAALQPYAIDLSSGVETDGVKDLTKMRRTVEAVRNIRKKEEQINE